jgi:hypothetical protein
MNNSKETLRTANTCRCTEKGQVTEELTVEWFLDIWDRRPGALLKKRRMLVLDNFKGHITKEKTGTSSTTQI